MAKRELFGIQYLRAVAALFVVLSHITAQCSFPKYFNKEVLGNFFLAGTVGVELFFVISGFIITYVSLANHSLEPTLSPTSFLGKRFYRIVPFMWICIIGYALLKSMGRGSFPLAPYLRALVLFPTGELQPNVIWTLKHEFLFYTLFCFFGIYLRKWSYLFIWFLSPLVWFTFIAKDSSFLNQLGEFVFNKVNIIFGIGFLIGITYQKGYLQRSVSTRFSFIWLVIVSMPLLLFAYVAGRDRIDFSLYFAIVSGLISSLLVIFGLALAPKKSISYLDRVGLLLGDASYSIYLTHSAVISAMLGIWSKYQPTANLIVVLTTVFIICTLVGVIVHKWVEKPVILFARHLASFTLKKPIKITQ